MKYVCVYSMVLNLVLILERSFTKEKQGMESILYVYYRLYLTNNLNLCEFVEILESIIYGIYR